MKSLKVANGIVEYDIETSYYKFTGNSTADLEPIPRSCSNCGIPLTGIWSIACPACQTGEREKVDSWVIEKGIQLREIGELTITTTSQSGRDRNAKAISDYWDS